MITDKEVFHLEALAYLKKYASKHTNFLIEEVGEWAYANGLDEPLETRWWGGVTNAARAKGIIKSTGSFRSSNLGKANPHPVTVWRSTVLS